MGMSNSRPTSFSPVVIRPVADADPDATQTDADRPPVPTNAEIWAAITALRSEVAAAHAAIEALRAGPQAALTEPVLPEPAPSEQLDTATAHDDAAAVAAAMKLLGDEFIVFPDVVAARAALEAMSDEQRTAWLTLADRLDPAPEYLTDLKSWVPTMQPETGEDAVNE